MTDDLIVSDGPHKESLERMKSIAGEHFDNYLIVVQKNGQSFHNYSSKTTAYGMAAFVMQDIGHDWSINKHHGK